MENRSTSAPKHAVEEISMVVLRTLQQAHRRTPTLEAGADCDQSTLVYWTYPFGVGDEATIPPAGHPPPVAGVTGRDLYGYLLGPDRSFLRQELWVVPVYRQHPRSGRDHRTRNRRAQHGRFLDRALRDERWACR